MREFIIEQNSPEIREQYNGSSDFCAVSVPDNATHINLLYNGVGTGIDGKVVVFQINPGKDRKFLSLFPQVYERMLSMTMEELNELSFKQ